MTAADVLAGAAAWSVEPAEALAWLRRLPDASVSLVLFSPPYEAARTYGLGHRLKGQAWVNWLRPIVVECGRVSSGLVAVNMAGQVRDHRYSCAPEWLVADLTRLDGLVIGPSPYAWVRPGIAGSGHKRYHRRNWEPVYCFARPDRLPLQWADNTAFGSPPKWAPGGVMSHRLDNGERVNQRSWRVRGTASCSGKDGDIASRPYTPPTIANPGNVITTGNGGGQLGHPLSHENEAPMNMTLAERFVRWFAPPDSIVLDCFTGSGTTGHAALAHGRRFIGCDIRPGVGGCDTARRRLSQVTPPPRG